MDSNRIHEIQKGTAYPDSISVQQALLQVWNECEQDIKKELPTWDDARNRMTPFKNLIALIENGLLKGSEDIHEIANQEIAECKKFIEQLKQSKL